MNCCNQGNNATLWILIALFVLGGDGCFGGGTFCGCTLPVIVALLYCLYKNGTLSAWLTPKNCCCCDN
ncbi:MAG: hypothetical protein ACI4RO_02205 [Candidatus Scatosoma sp.]